VRRVRPDRYGGHRRTARPLPDLEPRPLGRAPRRAAPHRPRRPGPAGRPAPRRRQGRGGRMSPHAPVLLAEVIAALDPKPGEVMIDGTFGAGGYSRAILERGAAVVAFDRDPAVKPWADLLEEDFRGKLQLQNR